MCCASKCYVTQAEQTEEDALKWKIILQDGFAQFAHFHILTQYVASFGSW